MLYSYVVLWTQLVIVCPLLSAALSSSQAQTHLSVDNAGQPLIALHKEWHSLGPFRIGTREAIWGADPLAKVGGFQNILHDEEFRFRTPLAPNATTSWVQHEFKPESGGTETRVSFDVAYEYLNWTAQKEYYGWPSLQYQFWTRGVLHSSASEIRKAWVYTQRILELTINGKHYFGGDFFAYNRAPILVDLKPGRNIFNVRLFRDVRSMGGDLPPNIDAVLHVKLANMLPEIDRNLTVAPDIINGKLPSRYFGFSVRNPLDVSINVSDCGQDDFTILWPTASEFIRIAPGQTRPLTLEISDSWKISNNLTSFLCYQIEDSSGKSHQMKLDLFAVLKSGNFTEPSKFTFLHPSGTVSFAIIKPPAVRVQQAQAPLILMLHGAGTQADSPIVKYSLNGMPDLGTFALFPTGMSAWSGDDWHVWGTPDALNAINAVQDWMNKTGWSGIRPTTDRVIVAGHSNGGQGTWYFATHFPDRTLAAVQASGYSSIETYVPYTMWREADPLQVSILHSARGNFRHELLLENLALIPVLQQQGTDDENVPVYNGRLMSSLRFELDMESDFIEVSDKPHWWEGVMTTIPLQKFYRQNMNRENYNLTPVANFSVVIPSSGEIGSKFGIVVDQLQTPDRFGRIQVTVSESDNRRHWHLATTNIRRLHFESPNNFVDKPLHITLDSELGPFTVSDMASNEVYIKEPQMDWKRSEEDWKALRQRYGRQIGAIDSILRSEGSFQIVSCTEHTDLPIQISRSLFQYYGADSEIVPCSQYDQALKETGSVIIVSSEPAVPQSQLANFPIKIEGGNVYLQAHLFGEHHSIPAQPGIGATILRPLLNQRLELVVWGSDLEGLQRASRLSPSITGAGQPDFVVLGPKAGQFGYRGALAMGFLDHSWNISRASYLP